MKVLQILPALNSGGVERGTLEVADALVKAGHESWVVSAGGAMVAELEQQGSTHVAMDLGKKSLFTLLKCFSLRKFLEEEQFDIVHVRSRLPAWVLVLALRKIKHRPNVVSTFHGMHSVSRYSEVMGCGDAVVAVSDTVKDYIATNYPRIDENKIQVIYRGVEDDEYPYDYQPDSAWLEQWYQSFPQTKGKLVVTLPGRLTRLKGHHEFLKLIKTLREGHPNIIGLIVGGEDPKRLAYAQEIYAAASEMGLDEHIVFVGHRNDMKQIYALSDVVYSLSSKPESFGRTVLEALSMNVPVIAWNHGGVSEILASLFPKGAVGLNDFDRLMAVSQSVIADGRITVRHNDVYLKSNMTGDLLALYARMVNK